MAQTTPPSVTALPPAPSILTPTTFATLADAFVAALATFRTELNALAANVYANGTDIYNSTITSTSTTSLLIGTGSKSFTIQAGKQYASGQFVTASSNADPAKYMHGQVTSYSGTTLVVNVLDTGSSGTYADWNISISGTQGTTVLGSFTSAQLNTAVNDDNVQFTSGLDASAGYVGKTLEEINIYNTARTHLNTISAGATTAVRKWTHPDKDFTYAGTNDLIAANITGRTDGASPAIGKIGEVISSYVAASTFAASATYYDHTSITLSAGRWSLYLQSGLSKGTSNPTNMSVGISVYPGNNSSGLTTGDTLGELTPDSSGNVLALSISGVIVDISVSTVYYFKKSATYTTGSPTVYGRITAIRIA